MDIFSTKYLSKMNSIGSRIKTVREGLGQSQAQLAELIGGGAARVSKFEKDQREPSIETLIKIAQLGNKSLDWLLTGQSPGSKKEVDKSLGKIIAQVERIYREGNSKKLSSIKYILDLADPGQIKKRKG
jgi:transcriptional regulator with XRE-family HTH domain